MGIADAPRSAASLSMLRQGELAKSEGFWRQAAQTLRATQQPDRPSNKGGERGGRGAAEGGGAATGVRLRA